MAERPLFILSPPPRVEGSEIKEMTVQITLVQIQHTLLNQKNKPPTIPHTTPPNPILFQTLETCIQEEGRG